MKNKFYTIFVFALILSGVFALQSCKKDDDKKNIDQELYEMATESSGFTWFKNSDVLLAKSSGSGHNPPFLRTRYNGIAVTKLDSNGKIIAGAVFPEKSLIVKELRDDLTSVVRYAILYKDKDNENADAKGWVWGYINGNGSVEESATKKGVACNSCHSQTDNIDYMLMNKYFP